MCVAYCLAVYALVVLYIGFFPRGAGERPSFFGAVANWDGGFYVTVAKEGYPQALAIDSNATFFPLFPMLGRLVHWVVPDWHAALLIVSLAAFAIFMLLYYRLQRLRHGHMASERGMLYLLLFPASFVLVCTYTESLFMALAAGAFLATERRRWWPAFICAGLACLTRNGGLGVGVMTGVSLALVLHERNVAGVVRQMPAVFAGYLIAAIWPAWMWAKWGTPLAFVESASGQWGVRVRDPFTSISRMIHYIIESQPESYNRSLAVIYLMMLTGFVLLLILSVRRLPLAQWSYCLIVLLISISASSDSERIPMMGLPRYLLILFPLFGYLGGLGRRSWVHYTIVFNFAILLGIFAMFFFSTFFVT